MLKIWTIYATFKLLSMQPGLEICVMDEQRLIDQLKIHEGEVFLPYKDTAGKWTIGVGRNLTDKGISMATSEQMLKEDIQEAVDELNRVYPEWCDLTESRQIVLCNMAFNMGMPTYLTFSRFWAAIRSSEWHTAADEMLDSQWARQVGNRATELAELMRNG